MKRFTKTIAVVLAIIISTSAFGAKKAKYVFLFIGDGMGFSAVSLAEAYQAQERGSYTNDPLCFTQFPIMGMATNYSANKPITCSSAAGTAIATGSKTKNGMLGMAPDSITKLTSIAYKIHDAGYKVGITSTVQMNHATPAAFYAHNIKRGNYYEIGQEMPKTGFEFFGGGGLLHPNGKDKDLPSLYTYIDKAGYTVARGLDEFKEKKCDKIFLTQKEDYDKTLPYSLGRKESDLTLAQVVDAAIQTLENKKGFFLMAEGGLIDYAAHSNNVIGTITEILDMDAAIAVAYEFYKKHPNETLIVVTADHETGGVSLGYKKGYDYDLKEFMNVKDNASTNDVDKYMSDKVVLKEESQKAKIGWTTTGHSGAAVPVWAIGAGSEQFSGRQDNTEISRKICKAMGVKF